MTRLHRPTHEELDPFRVHRQGIEKNDERRLTTKLDCLIDAARAAISHKIKANPSQAFAQAAELFASKVPILQRLAIFSLTHGLEPTVDQKLEWLLEHNLIYRYKTDVFRFLEVNYSKASDEVRQRVVVAATTGPSGTLFEGVSENTLIYERFNLLVWLHKVAPECTHAREALKTIRRLRPEFRERDRPELDFSFGEARWLDASEGVNVQEVTAQDVPTFIASRPAPTDEDRFDSQRSRYYNSISAAATKEPDWALKFLKELAASQVNEADLWSSVVVGLRNAKLSEKTWAAFLEFSNSANAPTAFLEATTDLLEYGSTREADALPNELMPAAQRLAERIWSECLRHIQATARQMEDWLLEAINRPGGKLARFWLERISSAKRAEGDNWKGIPKDIAKGLSTIIDNSSQAAAHARVVIASQVHYLFSIDPAFAKEKVLPLFEWTRSKITAEQCWHGFVMWGRWLPGFTEQLLPNFDEMISRASSESDNIKRATLMQISVLALYRLADPLSNGWFPRVIRTLGTEELWALAAEIDHALDHTNTDIVEGIWERWLRRYWEDRLLGKPKPFGLEEAKHTGAWALSMGKYFPEAVKLVAAIQPRPAFEHIGFLSRVESKGLARTYPTATADLLLAYFSAPDLHIYPDETLQKIWRDLVQANLPLEKQRSLHEAMFRFGIDPQSWA
jgi:hypothetical protein